LKKLLFIIGTRPEAIKMAPLILLCRQEKTFDVKVCLTAQHRAMLDQVLAFFSITPDHDLAMMKPGQTLFDITVECLKGLEKIISSEQPDLLLVQGDTTTAFAGALAGFYKGVKIAHIEAGLRSGNKLSPYPEEVNRKLVSTMTDFHFAPTSLAKENLLMENTRENIFITGNTVIDALLLGLEKVKSDPSIKNKFSFLDTSKKLILITGHRRESFGTPFENFCTAIATLATNYPDIQIIYPVHLNPQVQAPVKKILSGHSNIFLTEPVDYPSIIWLMNQCYFVITDSGGIQEEAPSLGKPVLVTREVTERTEGVASGTALLVGTDTKIILEHASRLLEDKSYYSAMANAVNPYGDGTASKQIIQILKEKL
jgi:UDP-N-acetylglucosamine 2-epimerase (non-hydrolysing)